VNLLRKRSTKFHQNCLSFTENIAKKHYGLFFPDTLYVPIVQKYQNGLATKSVSMIVSSFLARLYYV